MDLILKYFPGLSPNQILHFSKLIELYTEWNSRINVISRKDIHHLEVRHILHSLSIAKLISFEKGSTILDLGTGGGLPGIPLAIMFPGSQFMLVDSIGKKIIVVNEIVNQLGLENVSTQHSRAESLKMQFDFVVSRAVAPLQKIHNWTRDKYRKKQINSLDNGLLYLKGGDLAEELKPFVNITSTYPISSWFDEAFFSTKMIVYIKK